MKTVKYATLVHKASLPLQDDESVSTFMTNLRSALQSHIFKKLNLSDKTSNVYMIETYGDKCVSDVYTAPSIGASNSTYKYYVVAYTRKDDGAFTFGEVSEVQPTKVWTPVAKDGAVPEKPPASAQKPPTTKTQKELLPGWTPLGPPVGTWDGLI